MIYFYMNFDLLFLGKSAKDTDTSDIDWAPTLNVPNPDKSNIDLEAQLNQHGSGSLENTCYNNGEYSIFILINFKDLFSTDRNPSQSLCKTYISNPDYFGQQLVLSYTHGYLFF